MTINRFEDLIAWQKARQLVTAIYQTTGKGSFAKDYGLRDQIQRSAVSVTFSYRVLAYPDTDFHRAVCTPSRAHDPRDKPEDDDGGVKRVRLCPQLPEKENRVSK